MTAAVAAVASATEVAEGEATVAVTARWVTIGLKMMNFSPTDRSHSKDGARRFHRLLRPHAVGRLDVSSHRGLGARRREHHRVIEQ